MLFHNIHDLALTIDRAGRNASRQGAGSRGEAGLRRGKKTVGRKRHIAGDTDGRFLMVNLTPADISDSAQAVLEALRKRWPWVKHLFADGAYDRKQLMDKAAFLDFVVEVAFHPAVSSNRQIDAL